MLEEKEVTTNENVECTTPAGEVETAAIGAMLGGVMVERLMDKTEEETQSDESLNEVPVGPTKMLVDIGMLEVMVKLQWDLNDITNGTCWVNNITDKGKDICWKTCINDEVMEMLKSTPWKHWSKIDTEIDYENIKLEIVDVWHFLISDVIKGFIDLYKENNVELTRELAVERTVELFSNFNDVIYTINDMHADHDAGDNVDPNNIIPKIRRLLAVVFNTEQCIVGLLLLMIYMEEQHNFAFKDIYKLYLGKNMLNIFRRNNGYQEGTYIKVWNGEEDNIVLQRMLNEIPVEELTKDILMNRLEEEYIKIK